jgi:mono/diheme cytochrome c family protein
MSSRVLSICLCALLFFGCSHLKKGFLVLRGNPFPEKDIEALLRGKDVFVTHCSQCHGATGAGDRQKLPVPLPNFTNSTYNKSLSLIAANVTYGKREWMPSFRDTLSERDIWYVSRFIYSLRESSKK